MKNRNKTTPVPGHGKVTCDMDQDHRFESLVKRENPSETAAWCGTWYDCPACGYSVLEPSEELNTEMDRQARMSGYLSYDFWLAAHPERTQSTTNVANLADKGV